MTRVPKGNALPALWAATFPNSCCVYLSELLKPGISHFLLSVKLRFYDHTVYHWEKTEFPNHLEELAVEGTVIIQIYSKLTLKIKMPVNVLRNTYFRKFKQSHISA